MTYLTKTNEVRKMDKEFNVYKEMLDNLYEGVYFVDKDRKITYWNTGAERITGFKAEEVIGHHCHDNILNHVDDHDKQLCLSGCPLHSTLNDGEVREAGVYLHHKDGHRVSVAVRTVPIYDNGEIIGAVEVFVDDDRQAEMHKTINELKEYALHDQLTELPNRRYADSFLQNRFKEFKELKISFAVAVMDIDNFKSVNDTYGHDVGDKVLRMVGKTLVSAFRKTDMVGRWGGEEFVVILPGISNDNLPGVLEKARALVERSSLRREGAALSVTVSIGATLAEKNDDLESILKRADRALYLSKEAGRNRISLL